MTKLAIYGAGGRMGCRLVALAQDDPALSIVSAIEHAENDALGSDAGTLAGVGKIGVALSPDMAGVDVDVLVDFSTPQGLRRAIELCVLQKTAMVVGTTGLSVQDNKCLDAAAHKIPVLQATNFSLVVNVLWRLAAQAATLLGSDYDIEVLESHHHGKKDAPSGTAHTLVQRLCEATGRSVDEDVVYSRHGDSVPRKPSEITVQTLRLGDDPGQHTAFFAGPGERLEIKHVSTSRDSYALGALRAAKWLHGKEAGRYAMSDVLGL